MVLLRRPLTRLFIRRPNLALKFHSSALWASHKVVQQFKLADIGEGITECEVIRWNVKPSSTIQAFDPLCEVQSDKASVEITSPFDGTVTELLVKEGQVAKVGEGLCLIEVDEEVAGDVEVGELNNPPKQDTTDSFPSAVEPKHQTPDVQRRLHPLDPNKSGDEQADVLATPSIRHYARQQGIDIATLAPGSGRGGRIERNDVDAVLSRSTTDGSAGEPSSQDQSEHVVELGRTRYNMWKAMERSLEIPHFGYSTYLDITNLQAILPVLNQFIPEHFLPPQTLPQFPQAVSQSAIFPAPSPAPVLPSAQITKLTYLPYLLKTLSKAMIEWPLFRSSITPVSRSSVSEPGSGKPSLTVRPHADISIALSTPNGLYTPTLQRVNIHSVYSIASQLRHLSHLGRLTPSGLTPKEMPKKGGTITVSNVGSIGAGEFASPVLVPGGGVAIVALGRAKWVRDEEMDGQRRLKVGVSWSADHRVVEGAELAAFVECWRSWVEHPERLIGDSV
ncbi:CoA-dependent acyltransferase [Rickenella mellea]|uniref:Dihydrolipoamide acetyltransferase component of pyruvate dehydrogenase complex n=1 Tax=Rickenella mellea TaxID=50990 RepID=A0A4Y7Q495_9AGAM|nr:CoA-dependent acyltransferase [Rickenella mellea]